MDEIKLFIILVEEYESYQKLFTERKYTYFVNVCKLRPGGGGGKHHFFSFHICDRAAEDKQVEKKTDQNPTVHS